MGISYPRGPPAPDVRNVGMGDLADVLEISGVLGGFVA